MIIIGLKKLCTLDIEHEFPYYICFYSYEHGRDLTLLHQSFKLLEFDIKNKKESLKL